MTHVLILFVTFSELYGHSFPPGLIFEYECCKKTSVKKQIKRKYV